MVSESELRVVSHRCQALWHVSVDFCQIISLLLDLINFVVCEYMNLFALFTADTLDIFIRGKEGGARTTYRPNNAGLHSSIVALANVGPSSEAFFKIILALSNVPETRNQLN